MSERSEQRESSSSPAEPAAPKGSTGVKKRTRTRPQQPRVDRLPPFRILLHNDDVNDMVYVVDTICDLTPLSPHNAARIMLEAHKAGLALMLTTHRERAELYVEQFATKGLTVTMEPAS